MGTAGIIMGVITKGSLSDQAILSGAQMVLERLASDARNMNLPKIYTGLKGSELGGVIDSERPWGSKVVESEDNFMRKHGLVISIYQNAGRHCFVVVDNRGKFWLYKAKLSDRIPATLVSMESCTVELQDLVSDPSFSPQETMHRISQYMHDVVECRAVRLDDAEELYKEASLMDRITRFNYGP
jgi:hypothetical protein